MSAHPSWRRSMIRSAAVLALPLVLAMPSGCGDEAGAGIDLERMEEQPRYDAYEAGPFFRDQRVLQRPPEGTVPRDRLVGNPLLTTGWQDGEPAGEVPLPVTPELLDLGGKSFAIYCAACHGVGGYGGSTVAMNMQPPLPASLVTGHGAEHSPGYYFRVITRGRDRMPSYAAELSVVERWAVVAYLTRVLQRPHPLTEAEHRDSLRAERLRHRYPDEGRRHEEPHAEDEDGGHQHEGHQH